MTRERAVPVLYLDLDGKCQGQRRVDAVAPAPVVLVMDPLFDLEALT